MSESNKQSGASRRPVIIAGAAIAALALVGFGYAFGRFQPAGGTQTEPSAAPMDAAASNAGNLADLLPGLEAKVAANPNDVDRRVLLGQTYGELGQHDKAIKELGIAHRVAPQDPRVTILLATALMEHGEPGELRESYKLLDEAVKRKPAVAPMARLYQGDILARLGDTQGAVKVWKGYLKQMSAGDQRRSMFEEKIAQASAKQ